MTIIIANNGTGYTPTTTTIIASPITLPLRDKPPFTVASSASYPAAVSTNPSTWFYVPIPQLGKLCR